LGKSQAFTGEPLFDDSPTEDISTTVIVKTPDRWAQLELGKIREIHHRFIVQEVPISAFILVIKYLCTSVPPGRPSFDMGRAHITTTFAVVVNFLRIWLHRRQSSQVWFVAILNGHS
jgi:hypothetical protein